jgi:hypothetical protein
VRLIVHHHKKRIVNPFDNRFIGNRLKQKRQKLGKGIIYGFVFFELLSNFFRPSSFFLNFGNGSLTDLFRPRSTNFTRFYGSKDFFRHQHKKINLLSFYRFPLEIQ